MTAVLPGVNPLVPLDGCQPKPLSIPPTKPTVVGTTPDRYVREEPELQEETREDLESELGKRSCAFCNIEASPTWKRGPSGKGYLCNSCATNWINRQRAVAQAKAKSEYKKVMSVSAGGSTTPSIKKDKDKQALEYEEYYDDLNDKDRGGENNYYCRYCDTTWPLNYFRNRQQFGAHCSNCSRKRRPRDEPNTEPPTRQRKHKRARKPIYSPFDDTSYSGEGNSSYDEEDYVPSHSSSHAHAHYTVKSEDSPSAEYEYTSSSSFAKGLMQRLLNVVENKLVEVNELEMIRKELQIMKSELLQREDRRQSRLGEVKNLIVSGVSELRARMTEELSHKEDECKKELEEMRDDMMVDFVLKERVIRNMLEDTSHTNHNIVQQQLQDMRMSFERKLEEMKAKMGSEVNGMEQLVASGIMKCEVSIQDLLSDLSAELNYQLEEVRMRFLTLEQVIKDDPRHERGTDDDDDHFDV